MQNLSPAMKKFLSQSNDFRSAIFRKIQEIPFTDETEFRVLATLIMADISSEHWQAIHELAKKECFISAVSLLRLQYESLLRASWLYWCAKDERIQSLHQPLTEQNVKKLENHTPTIRVMLDDLNQGVENNIVPPNAFKLLKEFQELNMKPTNSFVHSGLHAFNRQREGYIEPMMIQIVQNSNGLESLNAMLQGSLTLDEDILIYIIQMQYLYMDCLPMHIPEIIKKYY